MPSSNSNSSNGQVREPSSSHLRLAPDVTDAELARALRERHPDALRLAMVRFDPVVRTLLRRAYRAMDDWQDARQEVYYFLFRDISLLREPTFLRAFVAGIAKNVVRMEARRRRVRGQTTLEPDLAALDVIVISDRAAAGHDLNRLRCVLDRLRSREKAAFVLRFVEKMSLPEIARALQISRPTVLRSLRRARARVRWWAARDLHLIDYLPDSPSKSVVQHAGAA